jgi:hypothetical protein
MQGIKIILSVVAIAFALTAIPGSLAASPATNELDPTRPWGEFGFGAPGTNAFSGVGFFQSSGNNSFPLLDPDPDPDFGWTFSGSGYLIVVDAFFTGDQFQVFDRGVTIGDTSLPTVSRVGCGSNPVDCLADSNASRGVFPLSNGDHLFKIQVLQAPFFNEFPEGAGYLCVSSSDQACVPVTAPDQVPEPTSMFLLAFGLAGAFLWVNRPRLAEVFQRFPRIRRKNADRN